MADIDDVRWLGERIGYGNLMDLAKRCWREKLTLQSLQGGEFAVGCCVTFTMPCPHPDAAYDPDGHCDWCCGSGWVTKKVFDAMKGGKNEPTSSA